MKSKSFKDIKCSKCGSRPSQFSERIETAFIYPVEDNELLEGFLERIPSKIIGVWAWCDKCKRDWRLRSVNQITDFKEFEPEVYRSITDGNREEIFKEVVGFLKSTDKTFTTSELSDKFKVDYMDLHTLLMERKLEAENGV